LIVLKRSTILERTAADFNKLVRSLELGTFCPYKAVDDVPGEGQYLCKKSSRGMWIVIF
jgi:hypothetical protein